MAAELHLSNGETVIIQGVDPDQAHDAIGQASSHGQFLKVTDRAGGKDYQLISFNHVARITGKLDQAEGGWRLAD